MSRILSIGVFSVALLLCALPARAADKKKAYGKCAKAHSAATQAEQMGHLREATQLLLTCSTSCAGATRLECTTRYQRLSGEIPTVIPLVEITSGEPRVDVEVTMDGVVLTSHIDGRALPVDPGLHEFVFSAAGRPFFERTLVIAQGERNLTISAPWGNAAPVGQSGNKRSFGVAADASGPPRTAVTPQATKLGGSSRAKSTLTPRDTPARPAPSAGNHSSLWPYVLGGVGLGGIGAAVLLANYAQQDNDALASCEPNCNQASVDHVNRLYTAANISFGVGMAAALGSVTWLLVTSDVFDSDERTPESLASPSATPRQQTAYLFDVHPSRSGALATVSGAF